MEGETMRPDYYEGNLSKGYHRQVKDLFDILAVSNMADSDDKKDWQRENDCYQSSLEERNGLFGLICSAIVHLAGEEIVTRWCETNEVHMDLCNRN